MEQALALQERREPEAVIARPEDAKRLKRAQVLLALAGGESVSRIAHPGREFGAAGEESGGRTSVAAGGVSGTQSGRVVVEMVERSSSE